VSSSTRREKNTYKPQKPPAIQTYEIWYATTRKQRILKPPQMHVFLFISYSVSSYRTPYGVVIDGYGAMVGWYWQGKTEELGEKPAPVPLCPPQIPHGSTLARTRASALRGQRLTAWAMARPVFFLRCGIQSTFTSEDTYSMNGVWEACTSEVYTTRNYDRQNLLAARGPRTHGWEALTYKTTRCYSQQGHNPHSQCLESLEYRHVSVTR
jgi:hypothetical protein